MSPRSICFHKIEDAVIILVSKGTFKQTDVYQRSGYIYAKHGGGYVRLQKHEKGTSCPKLNYDELYLPFEPEYDAIGRMMMPARMR